MTEQVERIVVGVDGSAASLDALRWAAGQAQLVGAGLQAVKAWQDPVALGGFPIAALEDWKSVAERTLDDDVRLALGPEGRVVEQRAVEGHPARVLLDASATASLLVVGRRGHGGFPGMLLGSVSQHVIAHSRCPVLVVPDRSRS